ncbi:MAG: priA, partial [Ilumatobacteraceae bacterium]|nr:priA [Ilumatobacteraceae bacterium]
MFGLDCRGEHIRNENGEGGASFDDESGGCRGVWEGERVSEVVDRQRVVRVLPDVAAIDKEFDYLVPDGVEAQVGDVVRIQLQGRRVGGWIVAVDVEAAPGVAIRPLAKVSGRGPAPELIELAGWASGRWVGRRASFLRTAAPPGVVRAGLPEGGARVAVGPEGGDDVVDRALTATRGVLRLAPGSDRYPLLVRAGRQASSVGGQVLVLCPSIAEAQTLGRRLRGDGVATAIVAAEAPGAAATGEWTAA